MGWKEWQTEKNEQCRERHELAIERIRLIAAEEAVGAAFCPFFRKTAEFLLLLETMRGKVEGGEWETFTMEEMQELNQALYADILGVQYATSYANPSYAVKMLGQEYGQLLGLLYAEVRGGIPYAFENRVDYLTILGELFIEIYNCFEAEETPEYKALKNIVYWYASDYCDVFLEARIEEQVNPEYTFAADIITGMDLDDDRYLYRFGEYITQNELGTARHLRSLPEETIRKMADVYTEGYRIGFINTGKDLSKKSVVNIRYCLGFEKVIKLAIENFEKMGLKPVIFRAASSVITKKEQIKVGYYGAIPNKQYEYDHRSDQALFMDKRYIERKLDVLKNVYEKNKELAAQFAGPAVIEIFGEKPFSPDVKPEAASYTEAQRSLSLLYDSRSGQITNQYIKGEERGFTIVAYPVPEIGSEYPEIFDEVIRINTLDYKLYEKVQQTMIDVLDQGEYVHILGKDGNQTDLKVQLHHLENPEKETIFENCVADVNIPVGEVFTSPVLEGTQGTLHVSKVYLYELQYKNLKIDFQDGMITDYTCTNFENEEDNKKYIYENILHNHKTLPLGEFAIGTNTTAYVVAKKYGIEDKMPILIAEKMGPHFAVGDTCYSWSEDVRTYNQNGKEIVAKENTVSALRREDTAKAYFHCHTDITIPYEELEEISVVTKEGKKIILLKDGRFALKGTEALNEPLADSD
ncbi:aminopeptidase [Faecalicatena contorta]|uniref:Leucyl aminopeptidase (Aminopeptidase T) n=1 Tax=Faecalicatena contorta TaxID=39482 RepID=A0A316A3G2_9FIRM|nr:aminopeptidase [Faecalicatena contorta]PWJ51480.1 leucyl aminopeptidase (aminopeptidase T) [Faecalicatena contorta]SUQ13036.1 Leucyl aminopeptidase (aminopeptidase T) [Faecalicatena contorta]